MNGRMLFKWLPVMALGISVAASAGGDREPDTGIGLTTLPQVVDEVLQTHPALTSRHFFAKANQHALGVERSTFFPQIELSAGFGMESTHNSTTRAIQGKSWLDLKRQEGSFTATQRLFDGFDSWSRLKSQKNRFISSEYQFVEGGEIIGLQATEAYIDILRQRALVKIARSSVSAHQKILKSISAREKVGYDKKADVYQARARLALSNTRLATQQGDLDRSVARFREIVGRAPGELSYPDLDSALIPTTDEEAILIAMDSNPTIKSAMTNVTASRWDVATAKAPFYPLLNLELSTSQNSNLDGVVGQSNDALAMLRLNYNLFKGGADYYRTRQRKAVLHQTMQDEAEVRRRVRESIRTSYAAMEEAKSQVKHEERHYDAARQLVDAYNKQFELGTRTLLALLDAEDERFISYANLKNQKYILLFEEFQLMSLMGRLLSSLGVDLPTYRPEETIKKSYEKSLAPVDIFTEAAAGR